MRSMTITVLVLTLAIGSIGCSMSRTKKGAGIGAASGAVIGGLIGSQSGNTAAGAIIGAAVGGAAGAWIGHYMDEQANEIERDIEGAKVERIGEGIKITFDSGLMFDVDSSDLKPASRTNLTELATILNKYADTEILLEGHTDATGSEEYNLSLSERRAKSVRNHLAGQQVAATRFTVMGYGEVQPIADNESQAGRQQNRRVEVAIYANEKLKSAAEKKADE